MALIDAFIPFAIGLLLALRPQAFVKGEPSDGEVARKRGRLQKIGYVLVGLALIYAAIALVES